MDKEAKPDSEKGISVIGRNELQCVH